MIGMLSLNPLDGAAALFVLAAVLGYINYRVVGMPPAASSDSHERYLPQYLGLDGAKPALRPVVRLATGYGAAIHTVMPGSSPSTPLVGSARTAKVFRS